MYINSGESDRKCVRIPDSRTGGVHRFRKTGQEMYGFRTDSHIFLFGNTIAREKREKIFSINRKKSTADRLSEARGVLAWKLRYK